MTVPYHGDSPQAAPFEVERVEWVPSSAEALEVRVTGRWRDGEPPRPMGLLVEDAGSRRRFEVGRQRSDGSGIWTAHFAVPVELRAALSTRLALSAGARELALPAASPGPADESTAPPPARIVESGVLEERRARREGQADGAVVRRAQAAEATVATLETQLGLLESRLRGAQLERDELAARLRTAEQRAEAERRVRAEAEEERSILRTQAERQLDVLRVRLAAAEEHAEALAEEMDAIRREGAEAQHAAAADRVAAERALAEGPAARAAADLKQLRGETAALAEQLVAERAGRTAAEARVGEQTERLAAVQATIVSLERELERRATIHTTVQGGLEQLRGALTKVRARTEAQDTRESAARRAVEDMRGIATGLRERLAVLEEAERVARAQVRETQAELIARDGDLGRLRAELERGRAELATAQVRHDGTAAALREAERTIVAVRAEAADLQTRLDDEQRRRLAAEAALNVEQSRERERFGAEVAQLEAGLQARIEAEAEAFAAQADAIEGLVGALRERLADAGAELEARLGEHERAAAAAVAERDAARADADRVKREVADDLQRAAGEREGLLARVAELEGELERVRPLVDDVDRVVTAVRAEAAGELAAARAGAAAELDVARAAAAAELEAVRAQASADLDAVRAQAAAELAAVRATAETELTAARAEAADELGTVRAQAAAERAEAETASERRVHEVGAELAARLVEVEAERDVLGAQLSDRESELAVLRSAGIEGETRSAAIEQLALDVVATAGELRSGFDSRLAELNARVEAEIGPLRAQLKDERTARLVAEQELAAERGRGPAAASPFAPAWLERSETEATRRDLAAAQERLAAEQRRSTPPDPETSRLLRDLEAAGSRLKEREAADADPPATDAAAPAVADTPATDPAAPAVADVMATDQAAPADVADPPATDPDAPAVADTPATDPAAPADVAVPADADPVAAHAPEVAAAIAAVEAAVRADTEAAAAAPTDDAEAVDVAPADDAAPIDTADDAAPSAADADDAAPSPAADDATAAPTVVEPRIVRAADRGATAWLAPAIGTLAERDPALAADLVLELLPAQAGITNDAVVYALTIDDHGSHSVAVYGESVVVEPLDAPLADGDIGDGSTPYTDVQVAGPIAAIAPLVAGGARRKLPGARISGRKRRLRKLLRARRAPVSLGDLAERGLRPSPEALLGVLAAAVDPAWTAGHRFTVAYALTGGETLEIVVADGAPLELRTGLPAADDGATATVALREIAVLPLLSRTHLPPGEQVLLHGNREPVAQLHAWFDRAQGLPGR